MTSVKYCLTPEQANDEVRQRIVIGAILCASDDLAHVQHKRVLPSQHWFERVRHSLIKWSCIEGPERWRSEVY